MFGYEAVEQKVNDVAVPALSRALSWVRTKKEQQAMGGKYKCPLPNCDRDDFGTPGGVHRHLSMVHKIPKDQHPHIPEPDEEEAPPEEAVSSPVREAPHKAAVSPLAAPVPVTEPEPVEEAVSATQEEPREDPPETEVVMSNIPVAQPDVPEEASAPQQPPEMEPPLPPPPMTASAPAPREITIGTALLLNGTVWWQQPGTGTWQGQVAADLVVQVVSREISSNGADIMLLCRAQGGKALWSVAERDVLDGKIKIVKEAPAPAGMDSDARPVEGVRNISDPEHDYFAEQEKARQEEAALKKEHEDYREKLLRYIDARDRKSAAAKIYKDTDEDVREDLYTYIRKHGEPSEEGKSDVEVVDFDIRARITTTVGETVTKRDTEVIVQWLKDNDMEDCLRQVLDIPAWEKAKEDGRVPADFVREVEKPEKQNDSYTFNVTRL